MTVDSDTLSIPGEYDILCGRGRGYFEHPGNRRMLRIIQEHKEQYQNASKNIKSAITEHVLQRIQNSGNISARFLKQADDCTSKNKGKTKLNKGWNILSYKEAQKKVAHTLREQKKIIKSTEVLVRKRKSRSQIVGASFPTPATVSSLSDDKVTPTSQPGSTRTTSPVAGASPNTTKSGASSSNFDALIKSSQDDRIKAASLAGGAIPTAITGYSCSDNDVVVETNQEGQVDFSTLESIAALAVPNSFNTAPRPQIIRKVSSVTVSDDETSQSSSCPSVGTIDLEAGITESYYPMKILPLSIGYEPVFTRSEIDTILHTVIHQQCEDVTREENVQELVGRQHEEQLGYDDLVLDEFWTDLSV